MARPGPKVFVVDDDPAIRSSLTLLLDSAGFPAVAFPTSQAFLEAYDPAAPGCLIADIRMPGMTGLELQERLNQDGALLPIIILTGHGDVPDAVRALKGGAIDFLQKPFDPNVLLARVAQAISRDAETRTQAARAAEIAERIATLTPREREVMQRIIGEQANKVIAIELEISERTVELHRSRVMRKMGVRSLAELLHLVPADPSAGTPAGSEANPVRN